MEGIKKSKREFLAGLYFVLVWTVFFVGVSWMVYPLASTRGVGILLVVLAMIAATCGYYRLMDIFPKCISEEYERRRRQAEEES